MAIKNVISKTKFSQVTATPSSLAVGEQAYSTLSGALFIGDSTGTPIKIAGAGDVTKLAGIEAGAQVNTVNSVNGHTGNAVVTASDVSLGNVTNESKATMFTSPTFTGTVSGVTKSHVGLGNVDNTADSAKPVSTAQQTALDLKANLASPTFTGTVTLPTTGSGNNEAATKGYVDSVASGAGFKDAVKTATTAAGTLATSFANGSTVGGIAVTTGDRILLKNQADAKENGIYDVQATGAPVRSADADNSPGVEVKTGMAVFVTSGTLANTQWALNTTGAITIGTSNLTFAQIGGSNSYTSGTGLTLTGTTFAIDSTVLTTASSLDVTKFSSGTAAAFNGSNITALNASSIASGSLDAARLPSTAIVDGDTLDGGTF